MPQAVAPQMSKQTALRLLEKARAHGMQAAASVQPVPMVIGPDPAFPGCAPSARTYVVEGGVCGFAWVNIKPARGPFVAALKARGVGRPDSYYGGYTIWVTEHGQSMARKEAHAQAMARVLCEAGVQAHAMSRID